MDARRYNRLISPLLVTAALVSGCSEGRPDAPPPPTVAAPTPARLGSSMLMVCADIEGVSNPYTDDSCKQAEATVANGFDIIEQATGGKLEAPTLSPLHVSLKVEGMERRCFTSNVGMPAANNLMASIAKTAIAKVGSVGGSASEPMHIMVQAKKSCPSDANYIRARFVPSAELEGHAPVIVQFASGVAETDKRTAAHEELHGHLGHVLGLVDSNTGKLREDSLTDGQPFTAREYITPNLMGDPQYSSPPFLNALQLSQMGLLAENYKAAPTTSGEYTISKLFGSGIQLLEVPLRNPRLRTVVGGQDIILDKYYLMADEESISVYAAASTFRKGIAPVCVYVTTLNAERPAFHDTGLSIQNIRPDALNGNTTFDLQLN